MPLTDFAHFTRRLAAAGFDEIRVREFLGIPDIHLIGAAESPGLISRCLDVGGPCAVATALWLLHYSVGPKAEIAEMIGEPLFDWLIEREFLWEHRTGSIIANVDLSPCLGGYFFHDSRCPFVDFTPNKVYELGTDSYWLARLTPRKPGQRSLDLCTGSGVHAILAALHHQEAVAVDLNPRALEFARINAEMNQVRCEFHLGDLYEPVRGQTFDLITINPPFVPTPEADMQIHRGGGETGEDISSRAVAGLPDHLRPGGTFAMVLAYPLMADSTYLDRIHSWLGHTQGWGVLVVRMDSPLDNETYVKTQVLPTSEAKRQLALEYLERYQRLGIVGMDFATVFIRRLAPEHPGFSLELPTHGFDPRDAYGEAVESYLAALESGEADHRFITQIQTWWNPSPSAESSSSKRAIRSTPAPPRAVG